MTIRYRLTVDDLVRFQRNLMATSPTLRRRMRFAVGWGVAWPLVVGGLLAVAGDSITPLVVAAPLAIVFGLLMAWLFHWANARVLRGMAKEGPNDSTLGEHTLTLGPRRFTVTRALTEFSADYRAMQRVEFTDHATFIYIGSMRAIVVPRAVIEGDSDSFRETLRLRWEQVQADRAATASQA